MRLLGAAVVLLGVGGFVLPDGAGVTSGLLAGVAVLLLLAALVVFIAVPGPGTARTLLRSPSLGGAVAVVCVLLLLSTWGQPHDAASGARWPRSAVVLDRRRAVADPASGATDPGPRDCGPWSCPPRCTSRRTTAGRPPR